MIPVLVPRRGREAGAATDGLATCGGEAAQEIAVDPG